MRLCAALVFGALVSGGPAASAERLQVEAHRIEIFHLAGQLNGPLTFLGGLQLSSGNREFGGFSGVVADGPDVLLVTDSGSLVRATLTYDDGRLAGVENATIGNLYADGELSKRRGDTEDIALDPADPTRGVIVRERQANAMLGFRITNGRPGKFHPITVGADNRILRSNAGLESVAFAPPASPVAGEIVAIAERPPRGETDIPGWIAGKGSFSIVRRDDFDVSSARFLPDGDLLLLERRFSPARGIAMRIRRIDGASVKAGARLDGDYLLDAGITSQIDNMEGLDVSQDSQGRTVLTIVSDDNFNVFQRTLILQFALSER